MAERGAWQPQWISLAEKLPSSLSKDAAPETLADGFTPDSFGLGLEKPGYLYYDSLPSTGSAWNGISTVSAPAHAPATATWRYCHGRLWGYPSTGSTLYYGAYGYDSTYIITDLGYIPCDSQESGNIINVVPFGNNVAVLKADCIYIIRNADNPGNSFVAEYLKQSSGCPVALNVIVVDNKLVWANTYGVWQYDGNNIVELTEPIRNNLGAFASGQITSMKADFAKRRVMGIKSAATQFIMELGDNPQLYDYATSGFRFTTRTLVGNEGEPALVSKIAFLYQYSAGEQATVDFQIKINDSFKNESQLKIRPANDNGRCEVGLANALSCRKFAVRIIAMSASLYISKILIYVQAGGVLGYSNK